VREPVHCYQRNRWTSLHCSSRRQAFDLPLDRSPWVRAKIPKKLDQVIRNQDSMEWAEPAESPTRVEQQKLVCSPGPERSKGRKNWDSHRPELRTDSVLRVPGLRTDSHCRSSIRTDLTDQILQKRQQQEFRTDSMRVHHTDSMPVRRTDWRRSASSGLCTGKDCHWQFHSWEWRRRDCCSPVPRNPRIHSRALPLPVHLAREPQNRFRSRSSLLREPAKT